LIEAAREKGELLSAEQLVALTDGRVPPPRPKRNSQKRQGN
jgi:hypothetical protein